MKHFEQLSFHEKYCQGPCSVRGLFYISVYPLSSCFIIQFIDLISVHIQTKTDTTTKHSAAIHLNLALFKSLDIQSMNEASEQP